MRGEKILIASQKILCYATKMQKRVFFLRCNHDDDDEKNVKFNDIFILSDIETKKADDKSALFTLQIFFYWNNFFMIFERFRFGVSSDMIMPGVDDNFRKMCNTNSGGN